MWSYNPSLKTQKARSESAVVVEEAVKQATHRWKFVPASVMNLTLDKVSVKLLGWLCAEVGDEGIQSARPVELRAAETYRALAWLRAVDLSRAPVPHQSRQRVIYEREETTSVTEPIDYWRNRPRPGIVRESCEAPENGNETLT